MTPEIALDIMAFLDRHHNGTEERTRAITEMHRELIERPETFYEYLMEHLGDLHDDPTRHLAERLLRSGAVHGLTSIADIPSILEADAAGE
jgi:hypothetical protein